MENLSIAAPDMGGAKRANAYSQHLNAPMIISHKQREKPNVVGQMTAIGDISDRNIDVYKRQCRSSAATVPASSNPAYRTTGC